MDHTELSRWTEHLLAAGYHPGPVLGSGMEGTVVGLGDTLVAKIWHRQSAPELETLGVFYDAVRGAHPVVATPAIHEILALEGRAATIEPLLPGRPLRTSMGRNVSAPTAADLACVTDVLEALAVLEPRAGMGILPVLEGEPPFDVEVMAFEHSLAILVESRARRFLRPLSAKLADLEALVTAVSSSLRQLIPGRRSLVHGDLIPANVLVDEVGRPVSVLDFGFLSTVGDPAFDAAIAASIFDMYGPRGRGTESAIDAVVIERFGYEPRRLLVYRAAYALVTANCFSASGSDGHFEWCMGMLARPSIRAALDL